MPTGIYKRKPLTEEHRRNVGLAHLGMKRSAETRRNISLSLMGRKVSEASKKKMSLARLGKKHSEEWKENQSKAMKGIKKPPFTEEHKRALSLQMKNRYEKGLVSPLAKIWKDNPDFLRGENNPKWIKDRTLIVGRHNRKLHDPEYKQWCRSVKNRDGWKCRIANGDCSGRLEVHHILGWKDHPELRYQPNNGITLCHFHHPRRREDEKKLSPYFQQLVASLD